MLELHDTLALPAMVNPCFDAFLRFEFIREDALLVTEGTHVAALYDLTTRQSLMSWTFAEMSPLTCPLVYDRTRKKIVSVHGHHEMRLFGEKEDHEEAEEKYQFADRITCVLGNEGGEPIVVTESGSLLFLTEAIHKRDEKTSVDILNGEGIVTVRNISQSSHNFLEVVILTATQKHLMIYNKLRMDKATHHVELVATFQLPDVVVFNLGDDGLFGGLSKQGEIIIGTDQDRKSPFILPDFQEIVGKIRGFNFFPGHEDVVAIVESDTQITMTDLRYGIRETCNLPTTPIPNGIFIEEDKMVILSSQGVHVCNFTIQPVTLASMMKKKKPNPENEKVQSSSIDLLEDWKIPTKDIIAQLTKDMKRSGDHVCESKVAGALVHILKKDPQVESTETIQLIDILLRIPFSPSILTRETRKKLLVSSVSPSSIVDLMCSLLDRLEEEDETSVMTVDLTTALLDASLKELLVKKEELQPILQRLYHPIESLCSYYSIASTLRSMLKSLVTTDASRWRESHLMPPPRGPIRTRWKSMQPYTNAAIPSVRQQRVKPPEYSVQVIYL